MFLSLLFVAQVYWPAVVRPLEKQVVRLEMQKGEDSGVCSGTVINKKEGYVLTAGHCVSAAPTEEFDLTVNGRDGSVVKVNRILDLAIVKFKVKDEAQIEIALVSPEKGSELAVAGFALGIQEMAVQFGHVMQMNKETGSLWTDAHLIPGDSGGPIVDTEGHLIGVNSRVYYSIIPPVHIGAMIPLDVVRDFIEEFLPPVPKVARARK